eukprot:GHRR01028582.1.p1 GENE.GHRR01028582.1~~GHRR01028582.1.p1  ORF type:complete len:164 (+),score=55.84 GHRR01028582.1:596-1087(+)
MLLVLQTALRDFPHARPDCAANPFAKNASTGNGKACANCFCYCCDIKASNCSFWCTDACARARDHCNAHCSSYWDCLRKQARKGNKALLEKEHASTSEQLTTQWLNSSRGSGSVSVKPRNSTQGMLSPAVLWARASANRAENSSTTPTAARHKQQQRRLQKPV